MNNISQGLLKNDIDLKILTIYTFKHPLSTEALPPWYQKATKIESCFVDTTITINGALVNLFSGGSYNVSRFYSGQFAKCIVRNLNSASYDIIHLESLFVTPYIKTIRENSEAKIIYRAHNIEFEIWQRMSKTGYNPFKKKYLGFLSGRLKMYEQSVLNKVDGIAAISESDKNKLCGFLDSQPVDSIPLGIDISEYPFIESSSINPLNLFILGSMDWMPNVEGLYWFLENVWKMLAKENRDLKLVVAGKNMPANFFNLNSDNTRFLGEIADAKKFMTEQGIMVVPLLSGSGIRVKILEAMALGKVIIATAEAVQGIPCRHMENILVAATAKDMAKYILLAIKDKMLRKSISVNARRFVAENYNNEIITQKLIALYDKVLQG